MDISGNEKYFHSIHMTSTKPLKVQKKDTIPKAHLQLGSATTVSTLQYTVHVLQINDYKLRNSDTGHGPFLPNSHHILPTARKATSSRIKVIVLNQVLHNKNMRDWRYASTHSYPKHQTHKRSHIHTCPLPSNKSNSTQ